MIKYTKLAFGLIVSILSVYLFIQHADFGKLSYQVSNINLFLFLISSIIFLMGFIVRGCRWMMLARYGGIASNFNTSVQIIFISYMFNNIFPFRIGDLYRTTKIDGFRRSGIINGIILIVLERILDLYILLVFITVVIISGCIVVDFNDIAPFLLICIFSITVLLIFPKQSLLLVRIPLKFVKKNVKPLRDITDNLQMAIERYASLPRIEIVRLILVTAGIWALESIVYYLTFVSVTGKPMTISPIVLMPFSTLSTLIPSSPGYVGTFDYVTLKVLETSGYDSYVSSAITLILHAQIWIIPTFVGLIFYIKSHRISSEK